MVCTVGLVAAADPRVSFKNFSEFTSAPGKAGIHYASLIEPDEGHGSFTPANRLATYTTMLQLLDQNLRPADATTAAK